MAAPVMESKLKALVTIMSRTRGISVMFMQVTTKASSRYAPAMKGTIKLATLAIRVMPPKITKPVRTARIIPV